MNTLTFKTGDHHKLAGTMPRSTFTNGKPKKKFMAVTKTLISVNDNEEGLKFIFIFRPRF